MALALAYVYTVDKAEELVADAIVAVYEKSPVFACEGSCACYLRQIVRNSAIDLLRKKYVPELMDSNDIDLKFAKANPYGRQYREAEVQMLLQELLREYPAEIRQAFIAHVIDQETIPDLAKLYGINNDTLRKQIGRMKKRIAKAVPPEKMREFLFLFLLMS